MIGGGVLVLGLGPISDLGSARTAARQKARARRGADGRGRVGIGEAHAPCGERIEIWSSPLQVLTRGLGRERHGCILPAEVIHQEQDDICGAAQLDGLVQGSTGRARAKPKDEQEPQADGR